MLLVATACVPNVSVVGVMVAVAPVPSPNNVAVCGLPGASSAIETMAELEPVVFGVNVTVITHPLPAVRADPHVLTCEKLELLDPVMVMPVMFSVTVRLFVTVIDWGLLVVVLICSGNDRPAGASVTAETPVPVSATVCGLLPALSKMFSVAVREFIAVGLNVTFRVAVPLFLVTVNGPVGVTWNSDALLPVKVTLETFRSVSPVLVMVKVRGTLVVFTG